MQLHPISPVAPVIKASCIRHQALLMVYLLLLLTLVVLQHSTSLLLVMVVSRYRLKVLHQIL